MTLGQRICALRRQKNLSQEALGEALGVSRQAISKWEGDSTIPEVDKLVAMSRLFGTSVGTLLGVETEGADKAEAGALSDRELAAVEAIAGRYVAALDRRRDKKRGLFLALAAVAVVLIVTIVGNSFGRVNDRMNQIQNSISNINNGVRGEISSLTGRVEDILKAQSDVAVESYYEVLSIAPAAGTFRALFTATPKAYTEGMTAQFIVESPDFDRRTLDGVAEGTTFSVEGELPLVDSIQLSVIFDGGGEKRTQIMEPIYGLADDTLLNLQIIRGGRWTTRNGSWMLDWNMGVQCSAKSYIEGVVISPVAAALLTYKNGGLLEELPVVLEPMGLEDELWDADVPFQREIPVAAGDEVEVTLRVEDNYGRISYHGVERVAFSTEDGGGLALEILPQEAPGAYATR